MASDGAAVLPADADKLEEAYNDILAKLPPMPIDSSRATHTLYEIIKDSPEATTFCQLVEKHPGILSILQSTADGEYTVFLPVDSGWDGLRQRMTDETGFEAEVLGLHISPHYVTTDGLAHMPNIPTILTPARSNGPQIVRTRFSSAGWHLQESGRLLKGNIAALNGVIHLIDGAFVPPPSVLEVANHHDDLATLRKAIRVSGLEPEFTAADIKGRTLFAPTNSAFNSLGDKTIHFLFDTEAGAPYLRALVKLHFCPNITFFSNLIWPKNNTGGRMTSGDTWRTIKGQQKQSVGSLLADREGASVSIAVTITRFNGLITLLVNGTSRVVRQDLPANDGVVQVVDEILLPQPGVDVSDDEGPSGLEMLKRRLAPYIA